MRGSVRSSARALACFAFLIVCLSPAAIAQSDSRTGDHFLGTWRLDLSQSKYSPGPAPKSETRIYARDGTGMTGRPASSAMRCACALSRVDCSLASLGKSLMRRW